MEPLVSVVIPTYNRASLLIRAIESVFSQSYKNFEIIVVDDASTDNTREVVSKFLDDPRVVYIRNEKNMGVSASRNRGIRYGRGEFVAFLDSDDYWLRDKLRKQVEIIMSDDDVGMVYTGERFIDEEGRIIRDEIPKYSGFVYHVLLSKNFISPSSTLLRKEVFEKVGFFREDMNYREDYEFFLRVAKNYKIAYVKDILTIRYMHTKGRLSDDISCRIMSIYKIMDLYKEDFDKNRRSKSRQLYELGKLYTKIGDRKNAIHAFKESFVTYPNFNSILKLIKLFLGV
ncbi:MAG: glycosyltransferase family 2 protein [Thermosulfidibacteraceae bacterium]|jgi:glycosyltransferase involved in cell wall biosynthesis